MVNAQEWLDKNYPVNPGWLWTKKRHEIKELNISNSNLEGDLDLNDFTGLEKLDCSFNKLTSLGLGRCRKLKHLICNNNLLTGLDFSNLPGLVELDIFNNNFPCQDLTLFSHLTNLEKLWIGNYDEEKIQAGIYNRFYGSFKPLKDLTKLKEISIHSTDLDSGLEYLPDSLETFYCYNRARPEAKVEKITEILKNYQELDRFFLPRKYNIKKWKQDNVYLIERSKQLDALQARIQQTNLPLNPNN